MNRIHETLSGWTRRVRMCNPCPRTGTLQAAASASLLATLPGARVGERVLVGSGRLAADVAGFRDQRVVLLPTATPLGLTAGSPVHASGECFRVPFTTQLLGHVLDAQARSLDGSRLPRPTHMLDLHAPAPSPVSRRVVQEPMITGLRAIDGLATLACGQRVGLFAGPGLGKSTLISQIAKTASADCIVLCLVGERGREVAEFVKHTLGPEGLARTVVVCATSDTPAGERARALPVATAIAEGFRDQDRSVLLLVDSLTRHVRARREIALALGEPPGRRGFPPSVFDDLAKLVERAGCDLHGSITAIYTVLVEGEAEEDPVAQETQALLDGHIMLDPDLAAAGCFPAFGVTASLSRLMDRVVQPRHAAAASRVRALWSAYDERRDLIAAGAYQPGSEPLTDRAIQLRPYMLEFIRQAADSPSSLNDTLTTLLQLADEGAT